jgi:hypothetical protein
MVSEEMVELRFRFRNILIASTVHDVDAFAGMSVIQPEMMLLQRRGLGGAAGTTAKDRGQSQDAC